MLSAHPFERSERKCKMISLMEAGKWMEILNEFDQDENFREPLLVWIRPSYDMLKFIKNQLLAIQIQKIISIGCGCGFMEWLLIKATGLTVRGLEVNESWWTCKHSTPQYIPLDFTEPGTVPKLDPCAALLFSYFNNLTYFHEYLDNYHGSCVILIGPIDNERHCDPEPDYLAKYEGGKKWRLLASHIIRYEGQDRVAIYTRI